MLGCAVRGLGSVCVEPFVGVGLRNGWSNVASGQSKFQSASHPRVVDSEVVGVTEMRAGDAEIASICTPLRETRWLKHSLYMQTPSRITQLWYWVTSIFKRAFVYYSAHECHSEGIHGKRTHP